MQVFISVRSSIQGAVYSDTRTSIPIPTDWQQHYLLIPHCSLSRIIYIFQQQSADTSQEYKLLQLRSLWTPRQRLYWSNYRRYHTEGLSVGIFTTIARCGKVTVARSGLLLLVQWLRGSYQEWNSWWPFRKRKKKGRLEGHILQEKLRNIGFSAEGYGQIIATLN